MLVLPLPFLYPYCPAIKILGGEDEFNLVVTEIKAVAFHIFLSSLFCYNQKPNGFLKPSIQERGLENRGV